MGGLVNNIKEGRLAFGRWYNSEKPEDNLGEDWKLLGAFNTVAGKAARMFATCTRPFASKSMLSFCEQLEKAGRVYYHLRDMFLVDSAFLEVDTSDLLKTSISTLGVAMNVIFSFGNFGGAILSIYMYNSVRQVALAYIILHTLLILYNTFRERRSFKWKVCKSALFVGAASAGFRYVKSLPPVVSKGPLWAEKWYAYGLCYGNVVKTVFMILRNNMKAAGEACCAVWRLYYNKSVFGCRGVLPNWFNTFISLLNLQLYFSRYRDRGVKKLGNNNDSWIKREIVLFYKSYRGT